MKNEFQSGTSYVPSFRTGSTDVNTIQHRYFQEPKHECTVCSTSGAYYLSAIACFCLTFIYPPAVIGAVICVSCQESEERRPKMISYFIELNEYKPQNRKCAEMAEFANQFGNTLCPDKISFDAFKTELEAKVKELNEKYPKTMPLKISSGSGFIHIDQDTKTHNNGCDKPVAYFFIYRVKRIYRFSERPQIEKKGGAE